MNFNELDQFRLSDTVKYHNRLNRRLWGRDEHLLPDVRDKLLAIAEDFREFLGVDDLRVQDITLSGSNAAYNYTDHSDIDLHLIVDMPDDPVYQELFNAKKYQYNDEHNLTIGGADVELYVQPAGQPHHSQGIYSVKDGKWIQVPRRRRAQIDDSCVRDKAADLDARIHAAVESGNADMMSTLWNKIKAMRQIGLEQHGEFGCENITFKVLRDQGCIQLLKDAHLAAQDHAMSLVEKNREKGRVTYGFGHRIAEDVTITPDGVSASTRMFLSEKGDEDNQAVNDFIQHVVTELGIDPAPEIVIHTDPEWSEGNHSFGRYEPESNTLNVSLVDRHILDVFRTIAHELVHCDQHQTQGGLPLDAGETGSEYENDANARAGIIMRDFAASHPEYFAAESLGEGASGYIPKNKREAAMPQYAMALSVDVHPGQTGREANKMALQTGPNGEPKLLIKSVNLRESRMPQPSQGQGKYRDLNEPLGPEFKPTMPKGTVRVDVSDVYDWYKLGKHIANLDRADPSEFGKGPPSTIVSFGDEDTEHKYINKLEKLGLSTTDIDPVDPNQPKGMKRQKTDPTYNVAENELVASLRQELRLFEDQDLFEINMGGKNLRREAAKTGALAGMEFEMIVPDTSSEDDELEPDFDSDERARSPRDIQDFFYDGDYNGRRNTQELVDRMLDDYSDWQVEQFDTRWDSDAETFIYDYLKENVDEDSIRELFGLEPEDDLGKKEYQLAADKIATEQLEPFYSDALELSRDEFYENDNFEEWLGDADLTHMSDIFHRYNGIIHWPHYTSSLAGGTSVEDIADDFSRAVGRPVKASSGYHSSSVERPAPGKNFYIVEPDGSLEPDDPQDSGLEFVSPPLPLDEIMSDLNKVKAWANRMGCYTNDSTGLHINISVPNYSQNRLDFVKLALLMGDEYVLEQFGRVGNTYARSAMGKVRDHVRQRPYEAKYLLDKMKGHMGALASKAIHSGSTEKYTSINTKDGHIEFRSPGGDWLDDNFDKIENTLMRFTVAMSAALDPEAYRQEYLKKLYKILAPKDEKDPLSIFAKYAAGELPAAALKSFVRQAQADRKAKKSGEDIVNGHRWRVSLKPELGGGVVEVIAADPIDAKKKAIQQTPDWRFVDAAALTVTRLDEPAAGASTTASHPEGRGRPNDPTGRYAITRRDDQRNYGNHVGSEAPDYQFRFTLPDGYSQAQMRSVLSAWAARNAVNAEDYMIVDTTQFAAPEQNAGSVQWNIIDRNNNTVHTFWNRNVQADANAAAHEWLMANDELPSVDMQGPFEVVPAAIPGSTLDLQRQRQAALAAAQVAPLAYGQPPRPIPGVQDIELDIEQNFAPPAQSAPQWEVYRRSDGVSMFPLDAATQAQAWAEGRTWVQQTSNDTGITLNPADYSVRQAQ